MNSKLAVICQNKRLSFQFFRALLGVTILLFFGILAYYGLKMVQFGWSQETWATQIPRGIPYMPGSFNVSKIQQRIKACVNKGMFSVGVLSV